VAKILGTKTFEYVCLGVVPPGVTPEQATAGVLAAVAWSGAMLPFVREQAVVFHEESPEQLGALLQMRGSSPRPTS
jgi:hypothetical protein